MHHRHARRLVILAAAFSAFIAGRVSATTVIPIADQELYDRADVIVHGVVVSSGVEEDAAGRPVTVSVIAPLEIVKGRLAGHLVLRQLGGELPDGRFLKIWARPEYEAGHEVLVFAIERADRDHQTAELLLGKFAIQIDELGTSFAVPALTPQAPEVHVVSAGSSALSDDGAPGTSEMAAPRELSGFLGFLRGPGPSGFMTSVSPRGELAAVVHFEYLDPGPGSQGWSNLANRLSRRNNGATAIWTLAGTANITGGGIAEAARAAATWNDEPNAAINYSVGAGTFNVIHCTATFDPLPDLVVSTLSAPTTGGAGLPITVTDTVKDQGRGSTLVSTTMSFYLSSNATLDSGDVLLKTRMVGVLGPNTTSPGTTTMTVPAGTAPGKYYVIASADDGGAASEISEANNTKVALIKLSPDLAIFGLARNAKTIAAGSTHLHHRDHEKPGRGLGGRDDDALLPFGQHDLRRVGRAAGQSRHRHSPERSIEQGTASVRIPAGTPPGKYYILGRADGDNRVAESNEGNNTANRAITIGLFN